MARRWFRHRRIVRWLSVIVVIALAVGPAGAAGASPNDQSNPDTPLTPGAAGTATAIVPLETGTITAGDDTGYWTDAEPASTLAGVTTPSPATWPAPVRVLGAVVQVGLLLAPLLLGIYLLDRLCGRGRLWPPWRGLR